MLRTSLRSARLLSGQPIAAAAGRQWPMAMSRQVGLSSKRSYADDKKPSTGSPKPPVLPTSETLSSERSPPPTMDDIGKTKAAEAAKVPLEPPAPPKTGRPEPTATIDDMGESAAKMSEPISPPPPPPSPPKKKGFFRRLRNALVAFIMLDTLLFGGGVWYSRINDNFHDFFTEYVPYGEQAVLYFEEMEFKKRFPQTSRTARTRKEDEQVRIPAQSGASWRVADSSEPTGRQSSASPAKGAKKVEETKAAAKEVKKEAPKPEPKPASKVEAAPKSESSKGFKTPEVNEPSRFPPLEPIDLMELPDAKEPLVGDMVRMLNDLILVINADGAHGKYSTTIAKAKTDVKKVGSKLAEIKKGVEKKAAKDVRSKIEEFDKAATDLVERVEKAMITQEMQWREEFESEMKSVRESYDGRVALLMDREKKLNEEKLHNKLMEQAIALKKGFVKDVKDRVEKERESRLGRLNDLSSAVSDLEKLTVGWNDVVETNYKTQQLHVAVEAVRASLEDSSHPRPFIRELVALKEIAEDDDVVDAAIASVNPSAYQRGLPTSSQLIDRFRRVAGEVRKASLLPDEAGVASHASSWVLSHVMFKKQGLAAGSDVESVLTRAQTYLEEGDLDAAAREVNGLDGWAKTLSKDWLGEVRKVLEVQQALDVIATEARLQSLRVD